MDTPRLPMIETLRTALRVAVKQHGWTLYELAQRCAVRVHRSQLLRFNTGQAQLPLPAAAALADLLGLRLVAADEVRTVKATARKPAPSRRKARSARGGPPGRPPTRRQ
jgi:ribosome-binding protein aMBF1 (putative translation factor)